MEIEQCYELAVGFSPNPLQKAVWDAYYQADGHPALLIRAGTGTGKTESILIPALNDPARRRIVMVLPSKALIEDMANRIKNIGQSLSRNGICDLDITVDMGGSCRRFTCRSGKVEINTYRRHLFADDIILTTLDKFLFRLFGYGEKIKSYIFPHRIFGTSLGKRPFVVFDEAHEYDNVAFGNFVKLLETLFIKGKDLCVMSATLAPEFASFLTPVDATTDSLGRQQSRFQEKGIVSWKKKLALIDSATTSEEVVACIGDVVKNNFNPARRIIARTEFVSDLIRLYSNLAHLNPLIYHGRLTSTQRSKVIQELIRRQSSDEGFLVIATSAIEAGCDLDAHLVVTEICNPDSLVQLAGRLNRRGLFSDAKLIIVGTKIKNASIDTDVVRDYMRDLNEMGQFFDPQRLQKYFHPSKADWMGEILFDMLWDYVYEGDLTSKPLWERGILVTRSWEPAITLCTEIKEETNTPVNPIQVGISRFAGKPWKGFTELKNEKLGDYLSVEPDGSWHADVKRAFFNAERWEESKCAIYPFPEYRVSAYENTFLCVIRKEFKDTYFSEVLGYTKIPKIFLKGYKTGFERVLHYQPQMKKDGCFKIEENNRIKSAGTVWYLER